ncbi:MAG: hypothetical protein K6E75_13770, partial [Lachnospiraceae bacterium]|nr:hypothetical protein [Lachnospiraceae bacterium]
MTQRKRSMTIVNDLLITQTIFCFAAIILFLLTGSRRAMAAPSDFVIDEDGSLTAYTGTDSVVEIPSGVTVIRDNVFKNNETITKVI